MKKLLINIGKKSKKAFIQKLSSKKKDKILKDECSIAFRTKADQKTCKNHPGTSRF